MTRQPPKGERDVTPGSQVDSLAALSARRRRGDGRWRDSGTKESRPWKDGAHSKRVFGKLLVGPTAPTVI